MTKFPKPKPWRNASYRAWIRTHLCGICNDLGVSPWRRLPVEAAHVATGGTGTKASDYWCVPLCMTHHKELHASGIETFQRTYDVHLTEVAEDLAEDSPWCDEIREWRSDHE